MSFTGKALSIRPIVVIALIVGLAVGYGLGYVQLQPQVEDLRTSVAETEDMLSVTQANLNQAQMLLLATKANLTKHENELKDALQTLQSTEGELATTQATLRSTNDQLKGLNDALTQVETIVSKLDNDRLLLIELRKVLPDTRERANYYWSNVKRLAVDADPSLDPSVDAIIAQIDAYFDWLDAMPGEAATDEEFFGWAYYDYFYVYEAYLYSDAIDAFQREVILVVVTHIDLAVEIVG